MAKISEHKRIIGIVSWKVSFLIPKKGIGRETFLGKIFVSSNYGRLNLSELTKALQDQFVGIKFRNSHRKKSKVIV